MRQRKNVPIFVYKSHWEQNIGIKINGCFGMCYEARCFRHNHRRRIKIRAYTTTEMVFAIDDVEFVIQNIPYTHFYIDQEEKE